MRGIVAALWRRSVWADDAIPKKHWEYRNIDRVVFPLSYLTLTIVGLTAAYLGIPALQELFRFPWATITSLVVSGISLVAFFASAFPRMYRLESICDSFLFGAFSAYIVTIIGLVSVNHDFQRAYVGVLAIIPCILLLWRLYNLKEKRIEMRATHIIEEQGL